MDQMFYKADQHSVASMVMGGASILEPARGKKPLRARKIADHIAARLEKVPLLRKKFVQDPLRLGSVAKVEDPDFNIHDHIVVASLPAPGGYRELTEALGDASSQALGINKLWRWTLLEGLEGGKVALVCQMHHALFDGLGAMETLTKMYDSTPVSLEKPTGRPEPAPDEPSPYALLGDAIAESTLRLAIKTPQFIRKNTLPLLGALAGGAGELISQGRSALDMPEVFATSLNTSASSDRRSVAFKTLSLPGLKLLTRHYHCTVNDMALLLFSFALEHYFRETGEKIDFDLWCGMPISTRTGKSTAGNQVTAGRINLHNTVGDPVKRLRAIHADTTESKRSAHPDNTPIDTQALGALVPPLMVEGLMYLAGRMNLFERVGDSYPVFNALLSNVPGPRDKVYIGNALMAESIPLIPAVDVVALSGGITSVGDTITFGFHCDGDRVLNPDLFVEGVEKGLKAISKPRKRQATRRKTTGGPTARRKSAAKTRAARTKASATRGR
jgi:WS/DGAT/MGAT family acyltransferase